MMAFENRLFNLESLSDDTLLFELETFSYFTVKDFLDVLSGSVMSLWCRTCCYGCIHVSEVARNDLQGNGVAVHIVCSYFLVVQ
jgi:hypothetical protein